MFKKNTILMASALVLLLSIMSYLPAKATAILGNCSSDIYYTSSTSVTAYGKTNASIYCDETYVAQDIYIDGVYKTSKYRFSYGYTAETSISYYATYSNYCEVYGRHSVSLGGSTESIGSYDWC